VTQGSSQKYSAEQKKEDNNETYIMDISICIERKDKLNLWCQEVAVLGQAGERGCLGRAQSADRMTRGFL
jgi:hypothetical protein